MKLVNYKCKDCGVDTEILYQDTECVPEKLENCSCGGEIFIFNFKNNKQVWKFMDER